MFGAACRSFGLAPGRSRTEVFEMIDKVRRERPIVHCITNYVTAGDVANMVLAAGASPIMADGVKEMEDIAAISQGLVLNLGTLKETAVEAMIAAGRRTAALGHPVVLDPVGAAASAFRRETALNILQAVPCTVIRGNASEIRALAGAVLKAEGHVSSRGVDADWQAAVNERNRTDAAAMAQALSRAVKAVIVMTGETDLVADAERVCFVKNGHPMMGRITGSGCMLDGVIAAFLAAEAEKSGLYGADDGRMADRNNGRKPEDCASEGVFWQTVYAVAAEGICGELAYEKTMASGGGTATFRMHFIDAMSLLTDEDIRRRMKLEV